MHLPLSKDTLFFDIEANGLLLDATKIHCLVIGSIDGECTCYSDDHHSLTSGLTRLKTSTTLIAHNGIGYDMALLNKLYPNTINNTQMIDTLLLSRLLDPERPGGHSLKAWGESLGYHKGSWTDWTTFSPGMAEYCIRDVKLLTELYKHLKITIDNSPIDWSNAIRTEHNIAFILTLQQLYGFKIDLKEAKTMELSLRDELSTLYTKLSSLFPPQMIPEKGSWDFLLRTWRKVQETLPKVSRGSLTKDIPYTKVKVQPFLPTSRKQISQRLSKHFHWFPEKYTDHGTPVIDEQILENLALPTVRPLSSEKGSKNDIDPQKALLRQFRITKLLGQLSDGDHSWYHLQRSGRLHGSVNGIGCRTHRMSHSKPNMAQVDKELRRCWIPDTTHKLVSCDAEGLELRMLAHYLSKWDKGHYSKVVSTGRKENGTDVHTMNQKIAGLSTRDEAKTLISMGS